MNRKGLTLIEIMIIISVAVLVWMNAFQNYLAYRYSDKAEELNMTVEEYRDHLSREEKKACAERKEAREYKRWIGTKENELGTY